MKVRQISFSALNRKILTYNTGAWLPSRMNTGAKIWLWKSHLRNLISQFEIGTSCVQKWGEGSVLTLLLPFLFLQPWYSRELEFTCWPPWWRCCQLTVILPPCLQESNNSQVASHQNVYFQHVASVPLIHLYREYHHLMAMGSNAAAQFLASLKVIFLFKSKIIINIELCCY